MKKRITTADVKKAMGKAALFEVINRQFKQYRNRMRYLERNLRWREPLEILILNDRGR